MLGFEVVHDFLHYFDGFGFMMTTVMKACLGMALMNLCF